MTIQLLWQPRDLWVGVYWTANKINYTSIHARDRDGVYRGNAWSSRWDTEIKIWICLLPCLPIHINFVLPNRGRHSLGRGTGGVRKGPHPNHDNLRNEPNYDTY